MQCKASRLYLQCMFLSEATETLLSIAAESLCEALEMFLKNNNTDRTVNVFLALEGGQSSGIVIHGAMLT